MEPPFDLIEEVASMRFPPLTDARLQLLMDRNNDGLLTAEEKLELDSLVEFNEMIAVLRGKALLVLGKKPE